MKLLWVIAIGILSIGLYFSIVQKTNQNKALTEMYNKGYQDGYNFAIEKRYIPAPGFEKIKRKNPELMLKFRG